MPEFDYDAALAAPVLPELLESPCCGERLLCSSVNIGGHWHYEVTCYCWACSDYFFLEYGSGATPDSRCSCGRLLDWSGCRAADGTNLREMGRQVWDSSYCLECGETKHAYPLVSGPTTL